MFDSRKIFALPNTLLKSKTYCTFFLFRKMAPYLFSANYFTSTLLVFHSIEHISQTTLATVLTVKVGGHENSGTTFLSRALTSQSVNFSVVVHTVVLQNCQFDLLVLMFDLFGSGVILLLTFLATTTKTEHQVKGTL